MPSETIVPRARTWQKRSTNPIGILPAITPRGLVYCIAGPYAKPPELLKGSRPTTATAKLGLSAYGAGPQFTTTASSLQWPIKFTTTTTQKLSIEVLFVPNGAWAATGSVNLFSLGTNLLEPAKINYVVGTPTGIYTWWNNGNTSVSSSNVPAQGSITSAIATWDGGNVLSLYVNGALVNSGTMAANAVSPTLLALGAESNDSAPTNVIILLANVATVCWTAAEVANRYFNPFGFLIYREDIVWGRSSAAQPFIPFLRSRTVVLPRTIRV